MYSTGDKAEIIVIGTGAVGTALAEALSRRAYPVRAIVSRHIERSSALADRIGATFACTLSDPLPPDARIVFFCVPDDAIASTANQLAGDTFWPGKIAAHTSGVHTASELEPLRANGASLMSFHPIQTFTGTSESPFSGIRIGIEGDADAVLLGKTLASDLGAKSLVIDAGDKPAYHLAASVASNLFVTLMGMACDLLESIGLDRREAVVVLGPLVNQTCKNVTSDLPEHTLTGPAARGDGKTIALHVETLRQRMPHYQPIYSLLVDEALKLAAKSGRLDEATASRIRRELKKQMPI